MQHHPRPNRVALTAYRASSSARRPVLDHAVGRDRGVSFDLVAPVRRDRHPTSCGSSGPSSARATRGRRQGHLPRPSVERREGASFLLSRIGGMRLGTGSGRDHRVRRQVLGALPARLGRPCGAREALPMRVEGQAADRIPDEHARWSFATLTVYDRSVRNGLSIYTSLPVTGCGMATRGCRYDVTSTECPLGHHRAESRARVLSECRQQPAYLRHEPPRAVYGYPSATTPRGRSSSPLRRPLPGGRRRRAA